MRKMIRWNLILLCHLLYADYPEKFEGSFEKWRQNQVNDLISLFLPENPVILQAGGHYGKETLDFAHRWPKGEIFSFEPNPHAFQILQNQTAPFANIHSFPLALYIDQRTAPFFICYGTTGDNPIFEHASSLLPPSPNMIIHYQGPTALVKCVNLEEWSQENSVNSIDFVRLDVNGSELQILMSSPHILSTVTCIHTRTNFYPFRLGTTPYFSLRNFLELSGFRLVSHWFREGLEGNAIFVKNEFFDGYSIEKQFQEKEAFIKGHYQKCYVPDLKSTYYVDEGPDSIKSFLRKGMPWEGNNGILMEKFTREGSIAIDVGAHVGTHTINLSRKVGPLGAVIAFEPQKKIYREQLENLRLNQCTNVISICKALGDSCKTIHLTPVDLTNEGGTAIGEGGDSAQMITLDSLNLHNVSLIKLDVENSELSVLQGAKKTILRNKPVIFFELNGSHLNEDPIWQKENADQVFSLLESCGYDIHLIFSKDWVAFPSGSDDLILAFKQTLAPMLPTNPIEIPEPSLD